MPNMKFWLIACLVFSAIGVTHGEVLDIQTWQGHHGIKWISKIKAITLTPEDEAIYDYGKRVSWLDKQFINADIYLPDNGSVEIQLTLYMAQPPERQEYVLSTSAKVLIAGKGWHSIAIKPKQFEYLRARCGLWDNVTKVGISYKNIVGKNKKIYAGNIVADQTKGSGIAYNVPVFSKPGKVGQTVSYDINLTNQSDKTSAIMFTVLRRGWEAMSYDISPKSVIIEPRESQTVKFKNTVISKVAPGGREKFTVVATPNGNGAKAESFEFITSRYVDHPYIIASDEEWDNAKDKVEKSKWAKDVYDNIIQEADRWNPPNNFPPIHTVNATRALKAAAAHKLTGDTKYAEKVRQMFVKLCDYENGYPKTIKGCNQAMVQEGHFFADLMKAYDLVYDSKVFTEADHAMIENTIRLWIHQADMFISTGAIGNWHVSVLYGAMTASAVIQDIERIERFIYGICGYNDQLGAGVRDDGWYYENNIGYNMWASQMFCQLGQTVKPFGYDLINSKVPATYSPSTDIRPYLVGLNLCGKNFDVLGDNVRNTRSPKDGFYYSLGFFDHNGVTPGMNDNQEQTPGDKYEIAYRFYKDPTFAWMIKQQRQYNKPGSDIETLLYGEDLLEDYPDPRPQSTYVSSAGLAVLRSKVEGRKPEEEIAAFLKWGSLGSFHGHYDQLDMLSVMRYDNSFHNSNPAWYGYGSPLYVNW